MENIQEISQNSLIINKWFYLSIVEFAIIVLLLLKIIFNKNKNSKVKAQVLSEEVDFGNIINSSFNTNELYSTLIRKYHPDRFVDDENKTIIANKIFQEITKNKTNYKKLVELEKEANEKLK